MGAAPDLSNAVLLSLAEIRLDGGTQSRAQLSDDTIADYAEKYTEGVAMPPAVVFYDGESYWLADGFHRCAGARKAGRDSIVAQVRQGSQRDAILFSVGANDSHGLRRTNADKRRAVEMLLRDEEWSKKSDRWIAETCAVGNKFVGDMRRQLCPEHSSSGDVSERLGQDGKVRKMPERAPTQPGVDSVFIGADNTAGSIAKLEAAAVEMDERLRSATPDPKLWWVCPMSGCGKEFNRQQAVKFGWVKRGFCDDCEAEPPPSEGDEETAAVDTSRSVPAAENKADFIDGTLLSELERLAAQRSADPEFAAFRQAQRLVNQAIPPTRAQRMVEFILDGGELALLRLGLDWAVDAGALQAAYRAKSRAAHPDRGGTQESFVALSSDRKLILVMLGGDE